MNTKLGNGRRVTAQYEGRTSASRRPRPTTGGRSPGGNEDALASENAASWTSWYAHPPKIGCRRSDLEWRHRARFRQGFLATPYTNPTCQNGFSARFVRRKSCDLADASGRLCNPTESAQEFAGGRYGAIFKNREFFGKTEKNEMPSDLVAAPLPPATP